MTHQQYLTYQQRSGVMKMQTMTVKEAAEYIGASEYKTYDLVRNKKIPHFKVGAKILFRKEAIDRWVANQEEHNCVAE